MCVHVCVYVCVCMSVGVFHQVLDEQVHSSITLYYYVTDFLSMILCFQSCVIKLFLKHFVFLKALYKFKIPLFYYYSFIMMRQRNLRV